MNKEDEQLSLFGSGSVLDVDHVKEFEIPTVCVSKEEWKSLCTEEGAWCDFEEVKNMTYEQAKNYIHCMPTWIPM